MQQETVQNVIVRDNISLPTITNSDLLFNRLAEYYKYTKNEDADVNDTLILIFYGDGCNGKTCLANAIESIFNEHGEEDCGAYYSCEYSIEKCWFPKQRKLSIYQSNRKEDALGFKKMLDTYFYCECHVFEFPEKIKFEIRYHQTILDKLKLLIKQRMNI